MDHDMTYIHEVTPMAKTLAELNKPFKIVPYVPYVAPVRPDTDKMALLDVDSLPKNIFWEVLGRALTTKRDFESQAECAFVSWLTTKVGSTMIDAAGNLHVDTRFDDTHRTMFTSHTDTVHSSGGVNKVRVDGKFWRADKGAALGADDGSGCALLAYMIECGVPGYYVFFRGEERGGVGSKYLADKMPELFKGQIDRAVAFDRAGYADVITHQSGGRCCSDEFAQALANELSSDTDWYMPCSGGVYTDTAEFTEIIPECTNISVGYKSQHGDCESQDVEFLWDLAKRVVGVQWDSLPTVRDPKAKPRYKYGSAFTKGASDAYAYYDAMAKDTDPLPLTVGGVYMGAAEEAEDDRLLNADIDEDSEEFMAMLAIEDFRENRDQQFLLDLIADAVHPEDPAHALRMMHKALISEEDLDLADTMLQQGWSAYQVLCELFDTCQV